MLNKKLFSTVAQKTLAFFCLRPDQRFHGREVARQMGEQPSSVQMAIKTLAKEGVLTAERRGKMIFYALDESNPLVRPYKVLAVVALLEPLVRKLRKTVDLIVLYGSSAHGTFRSDSDIDLLIVTSHEDEVRDMVSSFSGRFAKEIRPVIHSLAEWMDVEEKDRVFAEEVGKGFVLFQSEHYESSI